jgi:ribosomal protein L29
MAKKADKVKEAEVVKTTKSAKNEAKKTAANAAAAVGKTAKELRELSEQELHTVLETARNDLLSAQKMLKANELPSSHVIKKSRRVIARIHSLLAEKTKEVKNV